MSNPLITLAMVIGADIKDSVVFTVVPADKLVIPFGEREEVIRTTATQLTALLHLSQQP